MQRQESNSMGSAGASSCATLEEWFTLSPMRWVCSVIIGLLLSSSASASESEPLMIASGEFAPYTSSELATGGFLTEITMRAFELGNEPANEIYLPWARGFLGVQKMHFDATFPYMKTPERELTFLFSEPLFPMAVTVFVREEEAHLYERPKDFIGQTWCLPRAYTMAALTPYIKQGLMTLLRSSSDKSCMEMVSKQRVTAYPMDTLIGEELLKTDPELFSGISRLQWALAKNDYYLIMSKNHPRGREVLAAFNQGLRQLKQSPEWQDILQRHNIDDTPISLPATPVVTPGD